MTSRGAEMTEQLNTTEKRAVILLSGGLDSATVVAMARAEGYSCYTMSFDYGQRSQAELHAAARVARDLGVVEHKVIGLNLNGMGGSALTDSSIDIPEELGRAFQSLTCRRATRYSCRWRWAGRKCWARVTSLLV